MPELPEAETIVRTLAPHVENRRIASLRLLSLRAARGRLPELAGRRIERVRRYGKRVEFELDCGVLVVQLGMTGALLWRGLAGPYTRAILELDEGWVCFNDVRQFGGVSWRAGPAEELGPDPLEIRQEEFLARLLCRKAQVKRLLLDQRFLRGIGNIYADEILFRAGVHPGEAGAAIGARRARRLYRAMVEVLREAIRCGGSSVSDYVDAAGRRGRFQLRHQVYGRAGKPCLRCGRTIERIMVAQRGTHYCPACQPRWAAPPRGAGGAVPR